MVPPSCDFSSGLCGFQAYNNFKDFAFKNVSRLDVEILEGEKLQILLHFLLFSHLYFIHFLHLIQLEF